MLGSLARFAQFVFVEQWRLSLPTMIGATAIFLLLPRPRRFPVAWGALAGLAALVLSGWLFVDAIGLAVESFLFFVFSLFAVVSGCLLVTQQNPARAALSFALVVLSTCGLFMLLAAPFLMAATITIYAGAIIVTFLFVLMLAQQQGLSDADARSREPLLATISGLVLLVALVYVLMNSGFTANWNVHLIDSMLHEVEKAQLDLEAGRTVKSEAVANNLLRLLNQAIDQEESRQSTLREPKDALGLPVALQRVEFAQNVRSRIEGILVELIHEPTTDEAAARADSLRDQARLARLLRPSVGALSSLSGPPADTPQQSLRLDASGSLQLPAENTQYLGRSLFTDFLLPVELGGTLLLVATVGAIAIAQRRAAQEKLT